MLNFVEIMLIHGLWTELTFGSGMRTKGITNHIRKELNEIEQDPTSLEEWCDVIMLACDGARRIGASPVDIVRQINIKHEVCVSREYPFPTHDDEVSEHVKPELSKRGQDWQEFSAKVLAHIEGYTVPQYGDKGEDQVTNWTTKERVEQAKKYLNRFGKNQRPGQETLDFLKSAHYCQLAFEKYQEEQNAAD